MNVTKIVKADLDSPCRELSNGSLGIVVALTVFRKLIFCLFLLGIQFNYTHFDCVYSFVVCFPNTLIANRFYSFR